VFIENHALNKPRDLEEARAMLWRLSGRTHTVFTGLAVRRHRDGYRIDEGVASDVTFKPLDEAIISAYLARVDPLDKAGAYAIQEHGELIVERYSGSFTNIIGLPLEATKHILTRCGLVS
jgi:septum formation protein